MFLKRNRSGWVPAPSMQARQRFAVRGVLHFWLDVLGSRLPSFPGTRPGAVPGARGGPARAPLPGNGRGRPSLGRSRLRVPGRCGENGGHQAGAVCGCVGLWGACAGLFGAAGVLWGHWGRLGSNAVPAAGGLAEEVDEKVLHAAFIPFGDITDIQIPLDYETGACRGSGGGRPAGWAAAP